MRRVGLAATCCMVVGALGCDPGVNYRPKNWAPVDGYHWQATIEGVCIAMRPIGGLVGETWLDPDIVVTNGSRSVVNIEAARLQCDRTIYAAQSVGIVGRSSLLPGESGRLYARWRFDKPIGKVLKAPVSMWMALRVGADTISVPIAMTRFEYK